MNDTPGIPVSAAALHLTIDGPSRGPLVVMAPPGGASREVWASQVAALALRHRVVRFDYSGHGGSPDGDAPKRMAGIARQLLAALDANGIERCSCVGVALGGLVALQLAAMAPPRIERLVVANARWTPTVATRAEWLARIATVKVGGLAAIAESTIDLWFTRRYQRRWPARMRAARRMLLATSEAGYVAVAEAESDFDARPLLSSIRCPVLVVSGAQDAGASTDDARAMAQAVHARHLVLDPCAQMSNVERAEAFNSEVALFLPS